MNSPPALDDEELDHIEQECFAYFIEHTNAANGLVADSTRQDSPASIATTGLALAVYTVAANRAYLTRSEALQRTLTTLRFFWNSPQTDAPNATGYKGFYYHFLDMQSGRRVASCELSIIDSSLLFAGILTAATYFDGANADEAELRRLADDLYRRADWAWSLNGCQTMAMGWKPECGFLNYFWMGYSESIIAYVLGLGSPTFALPDTCFPAWTLTYQWENLYGQEFLYAGPLFIHQFSHLWIDFRGIQDPFMRGKRSDYFENSRRATYVQREYATRNPGEFFGYGENCFGVSAGEGPGEEQRRVAGVEKQFHGYTARGVPHGPDDGTLAPWALLASLPFAPEIVLPALRHVAATYPDAMRRGRFQRSFNPSFPGGTPSGWIAPDLVGLELGPIVLMIENHRSEFLWKLMRRCPALVRGLRRAGFRNGWL